jgi:hypothetical protein
MRRSPSSEALRSRVGALPPARKTAQKSANNASLSPSSRSSTLPPEAAKQASRAPPRREQESANERRANPRETGDEAPTMNRDAEQRSPPDAERRTRRTSGLQRHRHNSVRARELEMLRDPLALLERGVAVTKADSSNRGRILFRIL